MNKILDAILDEHKFHQAFPFLNLDGFIQERVEWDKIKWD
jgi:hypothetical protein